MVTMRRLWTAPGPPVAALALLVLVLAGPSTGAAEEPRKETRTVATMPTPTIDPLIADVQERTFRFFWETTNPENGLVPDRYPTPSYSSIAAVGFGLTTYPIGVERGYITRAEARQRVLATLRFLHGAPQGPDPRGFAGHRGFFYHFLDMDTGERFEDSELSTIDTAILLAGALFCQSYFDGPDAEEAEIRALADSIYRRVDWRWAQPKAPAISLGWSPEEGFLKYDWRGYNEAMLLYLLALGSPTFPVGVDAWVEWSSTYDRHWGTLFGQQFLTFPPLFGHQYTHVWVDLRNIRDPYMQRRGLDYFENSRRAVYAQQAYAIANPRGCRDYGRTVWGITASDGPADIEVEDESGRPWEFRSYTARGVDASGRYDDCTLAPTAVVASIPFAPELAIPATLDLHRRFGQHIYSKYGFLDAFNRTFTFGNVRLRHGRYVPGFGWVAGDYLGIDQGAILAMIENYRSALVWRVMRKNPYLRRGLERAGFSGGWLTAPDR
ncbi:MAG TPA: glucoamylase family protein [Candidatus Tectomicrobia bacterium]|nr:glucoamylase family protein [Candidatus Tectomicrobia bacterium]